MSKKIQNIAQDNVKLEDILKSIRGIIDDHSHGTVLEPTTLNVEEGDSVLELTSVVQADQKAGSQKKDTMLMSEETKKKAELEINKFVDSLEGLGTSMKAKSLDSMVNELMHPLVKAWLDSNLPRIVEKVVSEEIQKMIPKK